MGKIKKRIIALLTIMLILITGVSISGCMPPDFTGPKLTEEQATEYIKDLVEKSYDINVIVFGKGLPHLEERDPDYPQYAPVLENEKYNRINDIKLAIRKIYSKSYAESIENVAFRGSESGIEGTTLFPRYIENEAGELLILVDDIVLDYESGEYGKYEGISVQKYDPSTVEILKISNRFVEANVKSYDKTTTIKVTLIKQEVNGEYEWRLNSSTC